MPKVSSKRDIKVEILRIAGCFLVIFCHIRDLPWKNTGELRESAVFFDTFFSICVMVFFLITGFFIYNKKGNIIKDWLNLLKKFFSDLFIPFIVTWVICIIFQDYFIDQKTFIECIQSIDLNAIWDNIYNVTITLKTGDMVGTAGHLWFFYAYFIILLEYPLVRLLLTKTNKYVIASVFIILSLILIYNDYIAFSAPPPINDPILVFQKPVFYAAIGHVLYNVVIKKFINNKLIGNENRAIIINKPLFIASIIIYALFYYLMYITQKNLYLTNNNGYPYTTWSSFYSIPIGVTFILMIYNINIERFLNDKVSSVIYYIANRTFGIYLVHYPIVTRLRFIKFQDFFADRRSIFIHHFIYYIFYGLFIFIISLIFVIIIKTIVDFVKTKVRGTICQKEKNI